MTDDVNRVFLWGIPRTLSTAVTKCLSHVRDIQIINQPYCEAFYYGPDSKLPPPDKDDGPVNRFLSAVSAHKEKSKNPEFTGLDHTLMSYKWVRDEILEAPFPGKQVVLCRDQAMYLDGRYDMLPRGFKYSFLIRHPNKVLRSFKKKVITAWELGEVPNVRTLPPILFPLGCGFKELYDLVQYVKENIDPMPTILDADDLLQDPQSILSTYCARMGIPYSSKLLSWEAGGDLSGTWIEGGTLKVAAKDQGFYDNAFKSVQFGEPTPIPDLASLSDDLQECVKYSMPYYERLHVERIVA